MTRISIDPDSEGRNSVPLMYTHMCMANRPGQRKGWCGGGGSSKKGTEKGNPVRIRQEATAYDVC